jgi:hypothetical protein
MNLLHLKIYDQWAYVFETADSHYDIIFGHNCLLKIGLDPGFLTKITNWMNQVIAIKLPWFW